MSKEERMTIQGREYTVSAERIKEVARKNEPKNITMYYVEVEGKQFPPTQLIRLVTGIQSSNSANARGVLTKLGFTIKCR